MKRKFPMAAVRAALLLSTLLSALLGCVMQAEESRSRGSSATPPATKWEQIAIPALPAFQPKAPTRVVLPNGMIVFLTENHELPLISGMALVRGGSDSEPAEKTGLVELYGAVWRTGGTEKLSGDKMDDALEARAAKVETGGGDEETSISFDCLKADFPEVLGTFAELLRHPAFREEKLSLAKKELYSGISRRNDETSEIASMQTEILGYGKASAYARVPEYATVAAVSREDLLQWHRQHANPGNIILGVVGDFDSQQMEAELRRTFGDWPSGEKAPETKVTIDPAKPGIYVVDKSDVNQSEVRMIGLGIERKDPDYFAVQVMNEIFGGGFSSRLFMNLRTKAGLAYSVGGGVGAGWDHPGLTVLEIGTKTETTVDAIRGLWDQIDMMKKAPPTEAETKRAKDEILNSFIFNFDTPSKVQHEQINDELYGYPKDFLEKYRAGVEKVTSAEVYRVANQYLHREELKVLVIGNASEFEKQLATLGPVSPIDITIPSPAAENRGGYGSGNLSRNLSRNKSYLKLASFNAASSAPAQAAAAGAAPTPAPAAAKAQDGAQPPAGGNAEGRAAIAKVIESVGGAEKVSAVKTVHQHLTMEDEGVKTRIDQSTIYPDKQVLMISYSLATIRQVLTPDATFMFVGTFEKPVPPAQRETMIASLKCDLINVLQHADDPRYSFTASGKEPVDNIDATVVTIDADGAATRWWIAGDGTLLQEERSGMGNGSKSYITKYSGWTNSGGLRYPMKMDMFSNGSKLAVSKVEFMEVNKPVDPRLFEKPQH